MHRGDTGKRAAVVYRRHNGAEQLLQPFRRMRRDFRRLRSHFDHVCVGYALFMARLESRALGWHGRLAKEAVAGKYRAFLEAARELQSTRKRLEVLEARGVQAWEQVRAVKA